MSLDLAIARAATLLPIAEIAARVGIPGDALEPHGKHIAKLSRDCLASLAAKPPGKLILVTAINPTPAGEGKTTTTIGLGDALNRIGRRAVVALREPSLGPVFGRKGGATGGGHAQVVPMERINLHFTGDFHAITSAHNLLAAIVDNALYWGHGIALDPRRVTWRRVVDMNDRALRRIVVGLGDGKNGPPRRDRLRYHRRERSDGGAVPRQRRERSRRAPRADRRRAQRRRRRGDCGGFRRWRRDGGAAGRRGAAQPRPRHSAGRRR